MTVIAALVGLLLGIGVILIERQLGWWVGVGLSIVFTAVALVTCQATDTTLTTTLAAMLGFAVPGILYGAREAFTRA